MAVGDNVMDKILSFVIGITLVSAVLGATAGSILTNLGFIASNMSGFALGALFSVTILGTLVAYAIFRHLYTMVKGGNGKRY